MRNSIFIGFLGVIILMGACKEGKDKEKTPENGKDREQMLAHYADSIIIPAYASFKISLDFMQSNAASFVSNPTEASLASFRNAWANAYIQWQTVELFDFGPAETHTLRNFCNIYPADVTGIIANFSNTGPNLEVPASYPQQGFPALDYLINGVASSDASIVAYYTDPVEGVNRTAYIKRITDRMGSLLGLVMSEWNGQYKGTFVTKTGLDLNSSTSLMVNGLVLHYERFIRSGKIGIPSGVMLSGVVAPEKVEAYYKKDLSLSLAKSAHQAYVDFFNGKSFNSGKEGPSLKTYLDALGAKDLTSGKPLTFLVNEQFNVVESRMNLLMPDFYQQIISDNLAMKEVFNQMQTAVRMLKVDMTSAMSITITYTDNDGD